MSVPKTLPAPRRNTGDAGQATRFNTIVAADIIVALGDYTGGASENMFTLTAHGLVDGDVLYLVGQAAYGVAVGGTATRFIVKKSTADVFQLTSDGTTVVTNTSDGVGYFLKGNGVPQKVADAIAERIIVSGNDTTGGTVEDMNFAQQHRDVVDGDTIKLLYKSAAGVNPTAADTSVFVKSPVSTTTATTTTSYFQTSATSGGAVADTTSDGTLLWLKTS